MQPAAILSILVRAQGVSAATGELGALEGAAKKAGDASDTMSKRSRSSFGEVAKQSKFVAIGVAGIAGAAVKMAADFQTSMNTLQAVSNATRQQMNALRKEAIKLGADTKLPATSAKDAAEAMTEMVKAGVSVKDTMAGVRNVLVLSAAAQVSNARAAEIASNALNAFRLQGKDTKLVVDELANTANSSSVEINDVADSFKMAAAVFNAFQTPTLGAKRAMTELNVAIGLLGNAGIKGSDAGTSLKQALLQLTGPSNKSKDAMKALYIAAKDAGANEKLLAGITKEGATLRGKALDSLIKHNKALGGSADIAYDAAGRMRSLNDIVKLVTKGTKDMTAEERNAYLTQIFGSDAVRSITVLMQAQNGQWDKMEKAVGRAGAAQQVANAKMKGLNGAMEGFRSTIETLAISFGTTLLPPLTKAFQALSGLGPVVQRNKDVLAVLAATIITVAVASGVLSAVMPILSAGMAASAAAGGGLTGVLVGIRVAMLTIPVVALVAGVAALVAALVIAYRQSATFRDIVNSVAATIKSALTAAVNWVVQATHTVVNEVSQWDTLWSGIKRVFGLIAAGARLLFSILKTVFQAGMILLGPIVVAEWALIKGIFSGAWTAIKGIVVGGFTVLRGVVKVIGGLFKGDFHQVWDGIKTIFSGALTALKGILAGAWQILKAPVDAIGAGLHDAFSNTWGRIKGVFRDGVNAVIDFLNVLISAINAIPGIPDIKKIGHVGGGGGGGQKGNTAFGGQGAPAKLARGGAFARTKGIVNRPMTFMGEEAPAHPEFIIPTNPAYRGRAVGLLGQAAKAIGLAQGGVYSQSQLAALWSRVNPGNGNPQLMAAIAEAESRGRVNARNGPYNGLWQVGPGGPFDPVANARAAGVKLRTQGLSAWETYTNGSYKQFLGGGGGVLGAIGGFIGNAVDTVKHLLGKLPSPSGLGMFAGLGKYVVGKAKDYVKGAVGSLFSSGGGSEPGAAGGPSGVGSFAGVPMANWVAQALSYAQRKLGIALHPTSGYRPGLDPHTASGSSEHSGTQYPHGAVDFGGYHDPRALATKMAVVNATRDFRWPLLAPMGFVDDGHASGTGHYKGGVWGGYAGGTGGAVKGMAWVGEKGAELVNFKGGEQVFSHGASMRLANQRRIIATRAPHKGVVRNLNTGGLATTDVSTATDTGTGGDPNQPLIDTITAQTDAITAQTAVDQALADATAANTAEQKRQTDFATSVANTSNFQLTKTLADLISGHIVGTGVAGRAFTPGTGVEHVY